MNYETELGYEVRETLRGLEVYDGDTLLCTLDGRTLADYRYNGEIDDETLESDIEDEVAVEEFIDYQADYC